MTSDDVKAEAIETLRDIADRIERGDAFLESVNHRSGYEGLPDKLTVEYWNRTDE